ncbi:hypothetical protein C8A01DRAFT_45244 [Parachaetomium inaequale]|uniref:Uncharacterized protein n=1 Tax=Parachaetomium inaequale TaxID=2588326 RepID=A0AAN6ST44_9PEZI|nr:hypothetical protein C8A01DRAFT_45244 [Parachaetomium inaequale]
MEPTQKRRKPLPVDGLPIRSPAPVPRPRPTVPVDRKLSRPLLPTVTGQDGPLTENPGLIRYKPPCHPRQFPDDITIKQYRALWTKLHRQAQRPRAMGSTPKPKSWRAVKIPAARLLAAQRLGRQLWGGLERQCSWDILPSLPLSWVGIGWSHSVTRRRTRARRFVRHIVDNERWKKVEFAWEADAWTDVFGLMRDDPLLAVHCGLISDPRWGDANLVFPFAVYEAKGWGGDPREARQQACSAGAVYLDLLEVLAKRPGKHKPGKILEDQTPESRNTQVFVFTSFGAHWHILVGYKRPRLEREYAGQEGMSKSVYVFQRIWSARVVTEKKAWELLSLVDQIHLWGVTDHREFVIRHLKPWHRYAERCYARDVEHMLGYVDTAGWLNPKTHARQWSVPQNCIWLPEWRWHLTNNSQKRHKLLISRAALQIKEAFVRHQGAAEARAGARAGEDIDAPVDGGVCVIDDKGRYRLESWDEYLTDSSEGLEEVKVEEFGSVEFRLEEVKVEEFRLEEFRLEEFKLEEFRLEEFRLEEFRLEEFKLEEFRLEELEEFKLEEFRLEEFRLEEFRLS